MEKIVCLTDCPQLIPFAAQWFSEKWGVPEEVYLESMKIPLHGGAVPRWYVCTEDNSIIGGAGVIENDFHERTDLAPNVCAVYVNENSRGRGIAGRLLERICEDMHEVGFDTLYLVTDHTSFYERYGWTYFCGTRGNDGGTARVYVHEFGKSR